MVLAAKAANPPQAGKPECQAQGCTHPWNPSKVDDADRDICMKCRRTAILAGYTYTHKTLGALKLGSLHSVATATSQAVRANATHANPDPMLMQQQALYQQQLLQLQQVQAQAMQRAQAGAQCHLPQQQMVPGTQQQVPQQAQVNPQAMPGPYLAQPLVNPFVQAQQASLQGLQQGFMANPMNPMQAQGLFPFPTVQGMQMQQCGSGAVRVNSNPANPLPAGTVAGVSTGGAPGVPASFGFGVMPDPYGLAANTLTDHAYSTSTPASDPDSDEYRFTH